jgi:hypothetical protein
MLIAKSKEDKDVYKLNFTSNIYLAIEIDGNNLKLVNYLFPDILLANHSNKTKDLLVPDHIDSLYPSVILGNYKPFLDLNNKNYQGAYSKLIS